MLNILPYIAIGSAMIGMIFLSLFCYSITGRNKRIVLRNLLAALTFIGIFAAYVYAAITFKLPFF